MANCRGKNTKEAYGAVMENLRILRKQNQVSVEELASYLENHGIFNNVKTIYGWENGIGTPSFDAILLMCSFYGVTDVFQLADMHISSANISEISDYPIFTDEEKKLIAAYRERKEYQKAIRRLLLEECSL